MFVALIRWFAGGWPRPVDAGDDLRRSLGFLDSELDPETVLRASFVSAVVLGTLALVSTTVVPAPWNLVVAVPGLVAAIAVAVGGPAVPRCLASARRTRALGATPSLLTRMTLRMRLSPAPERAARFAAESGDGPLARSLRGHVRRCRSGPKTGLESFAREWTEWFPELERACSLVESAGQVPERDRDETLERARTAVLDASRDHVADFAAWIRGPATALYAFGVLLPLSLVAMLPALRAAGVPAEVPLVVVVYDVLLPTAILCASGWLLARRPVAFPPPSVGRSHPDVPSNRWRGPVAGVAGAALAWWATTLSLPAWTGPLAAAGGGAGTALVVRYRPTAKVRERVREVETGLSDALSLVGRRVERGDSVEAALPAVADELPGATGDVLAGAARRQRHLGVDVETAFLGPGGVLRTVPSQRARSAASLLALSAAEGRPAGGALAAMGNHLQELATVEREARRAVEQVTSTLSNTAAVFGPLVGGATVALAGAMGSSGPLASGTNVPGLGLAVGVYVLVLAVLLTALSTGLSRGFDRALVGYRVGLALLAATATYLSAFTGAGLAV